MNRPDPQDIERLLEQGRWVRALAARLVDEGAADDVLQDTWVAALEGAPHLGAGEGGLGRLQAWLAGAARNLARKRHRDEGARASRERAHADRRAAESATAAAAGASGRLTGGTPATDSGADPASELERLELQRRVVDLVLGLEEPYRSTIVARYLDERRVAEIAADKGVSPAAVRQRLSRGLSQLRARLDEEHGGDRAAWCLAFAGLAKLPASPLLPLGTAPSATPSPPAFMGATSAATSASSGGSLATLLTGGLLLATKSTVASLAAATAVALISLGAYLATRPTPLDPQGAPSLESVDAGRSAPAALATPERDLDAPSVPDASRTRGLGAAPALAGERARAAYFEGLVVDAQGTPIEGAFVYADETAQRTQSDAAGRFQLPLSDPDVDAHVLVARHGELLPSRLVVTSEERGTVYFRLLPRPRLFGRVLDPDGVPVEGPGRFWIDWNTPGSDSFGSLDTELDAEGRFELQVPSACTWIGYFARVEGYPTAKHEVEIELTGGESHELEIQLVHGARVTGLILDEVTRAPVPGAEVWTDSWDFDADGLHPKTIADAHGRFELVGVEPDKHVLEDGTVLAIVRVMASAQGYATSPMRAYAARWSETGPFHFEVSITPSGCNLQGIVLLPDGETPAAGTYVHGIDAQGNYSMDVADAEGHFSFEDRPTGSFHVMARRGEFSDADGGRSGTAVYELAAGDSPLERLVLDGLARSLIEGQVLRDDGSPLAGGAVEASYSFGGPNVRIGMDSIRVETDEKGRYRFEGLPPGHYDIAPRVAGCSAPEGRDLELEAHGVRRGLDFSVSPCLSVAGQAWSGSHDPNGLRVALFDASGERITGHIDLEPDADGLLAFRFEPMPRGVYELRLLAGDKALGRLQVGPQDALDVRISPDGG